MRTTRGRRGGFVGSDAELCAGDPFGDGTRTGDCSISGVCRLRGQGLPSHYRPLRDVGYGTERPEGGRERKVYNRV